MFMEVDIRHRTASANVLLNDIHLHFQGQTFQVIILTYIGWKIQTLLLLWDRMSGNCLRMAPLGIWLTFSRSRIMKCDYPAKRWELAKSAQVCLLYSMIFAIEWDHCVILTFIYKVKHVLTMHLLYKLSQAADVPGRFASIRTTRRGVALVYFVL